MKTKQSNKTDQGMVLIVALIMLAMVTFMVVAFLAYARVDRSSVAMSMRETNARFSVEATQARVQALLNRAMNGGAGPFANGAGASQNGGVGSGATQITPEYTHGDLTGLNSFGTNNARPPVYVDLDGDGEYDEFRYFLNLNQDINATTLAAIYQPTTPEEIGDPHWIGVLEDPDSPHGPDNRFVARNAYLVVPTDQQLDINRVHNKNKSIPRNEHGAYPEGYQRLHGNACWEMNLAGALAMIDSQMFNYEYYVQLIDMSKPSIVPGLQSSSGRAFEYAGGPHTDFATYGYCGLWNYRYPNNNRDNINNRILNLDDVAMDRANHREFIDLLDFLKKPGLTDVKGEKGYPDNPTDTEYLYDYFTNPGQGGLALYDMLGSITTHAAVSPTNHLSPQTMKPILGMPPTEKLLINKFFNDNDFTVGTTSLPSATFDLEGVAKKNIAEVILFNEKHGLTTGQYVFFKGTSDSSRSSLYEYIDQPREPGTVGYTEPGPAQSVSGRRLFVEVMDSRRVRLWDVPVRRGASLPLESHLVRFSAYQHDTAGMPRRPGGILMHVSDLSNPIEGISLNLKYDLLAKKFTQLASLMLQNAMVRTRGGLGEEFHIGSDPNLVLFDNEEAATYFGADNIQIYPPAENNFTPEVQRLLQVALNLAEVYAPDTVTNLPFGQGPLRLAWPRVFQPIIFREDGDSGRIFIAGWRRVASFAAFDSIPVKDLPATGLSPFIGPFDRLGDVPDRPWVPAAPSAVPPRRQAGVPPVSGNGVTGFPLLIGVNKRTQGTPNSPFKIWPSVNELSVALKWQVNHSSGRVDPVLQVGVELRDNLYHLGVELEDGTYRSPLELKAIVKGQIDGNLIGAGVVPDDFGPRALYANEEFSITPGKPLLPYISFTFPLTVGMGDSSKRTSWKVGNLQLNADVTIVGRDTNDPNAVWRIIDFAHLNFAANLPMQWEPWQASRTYKPGEQTEIGGQRYYARRGHESFDFATDLGNMCWKRAIWNRNETFRYNEIIRCREIFNGRSQDRLFRCLRQHTTTRDPSGRFDPTLAAPDGQLLWAPYTGEVYEMSWQVNDPLVNGVGRDYTLVHPLVPNNVHPNKLPYIKYLPLGAVENISNNLGLENFLYRPWNVADTRNLPTPNYSRPWADSYDHISLKDPGIFSEQSWMFPHKDTGGIETLGWLGLVHRGTPWQSVYLKSKPADRLLVSSIDAVSGVITPDSVPFFWDGDRVKLEGGLPEYQNRFGNILQPGGMTLWDSNFVVNLLSDGGGYTHDSDNPASWMYLINTNPWRRQTGTLDTLPTNDHRLVDIFSTPPSGTSEGAQTSLLSVNAKSPAAWAAVLSGVAVPKSVIGNYDALEPHPKHPGNCTELGCVSFNWNGDFSLRLAPYQSMRNLVKSINEHRALHGGDQDNKNFERVSDILSVPELTVSQPAYQAMIARRNADRAESPGRPGWWAPYYPDELDYERIPQQILSLLRTDSTPRFVAYVFSQTLKPARGSLDEDGLCTNYAIDREAARRTVFRIEGMEKLREYHYRIKLGLPNPNPDGGDERPATRMVEESSVPLKLRR